MRYGTQVALCKEVNELLGLLCQNWPQVQNAYPDEFCLRSSDLESQPKVLPPLQMQSCTLEAICVTESTHTRFCVVSSESPTYNMWAEGNFKTWIQFTFLSVSALDWTCPGKNKSAGMLETTFQHRFLLHRHLLLKLNNLNCILRYTRNSSIFTHHDDILITRLLWRQAG